MDTIPAATIQDMIKAGRIVEARTLLTVQESALSTEELRAFTLELEQRQAEAEAAISQAERLEISGKTEEAKALYESVLLFAVDYPGIQEHVKRMDEALLLTKAIKHRSRRIRESSSVPKKRTAGKRLLTLLGTGVAGGLTVAILLLLLEKPEPQQIPFSEKTSPTAPGQTLAAKPQEVKAAATEPSAPPLKEKAITGTTLRSAGSSSVGTANAFTARKNSRCTASRPRTGGGAAKRVTTIAPSSAARLREPGGSRAPSIAARK